MEASQKIYDARGNGGGLISPTITGDHQDRITDYTAIVLREPICLATIAPNAEMTTNGVSPTLLARAGTGGGQLPIILDENDRRNEFGGGTVEEPILLESNQNHATVQTDGVSTALPASMGMGGGYVPMITEKDKPEEESRSYQEQVGSLCASGYGKLGTQEAQNDMFVVEKTFAMQAIGEYKESEAASALKRRDYKDATDLVAAVDCRNSTENAETNGALQAKPNGGYNLNSNQVCRTRSVVRRLTPRECERLQQLPDDWTNLGEWTDSQKKTHKNADSPRYKAVGNGVALPWWRWLLKRISAQYIDAPTLGSLFDGVGSFPLLHESINGMGTARWASEIEPFCVAVTKRHFGDEETGEEGDWWKYLYR